ncbi:MAG: hypothetical protein AAB229_02110 [Candidatus Hydrogenedentota bacterium]
MNPIPVLSLIAQQRQEWPRFRVATIALVASSTADTGDESRPIELFVQFREGASSRAGELEQLLARILSCGVKIIATEEPDAERWPLAREDMIFIP